MDPAAAEDWIRANVEPVGAIKSAHKHPWATVLRVPLADNVEPVESLARSSILR